MSRGSREAAEARAAKLQARAHEAAKAMSEVAAEARRVDENTARLKALRLARDARLEAEAAEAAEAKSVAAEAKAAAKAARAAKRKTAK